MNLKSVLACAAVVVLAACTAAPVRNVSDAPVVTGSGKPARPRMCVARSFAQAMRLAGR